MFIITDPPLQYGERWKTIGVTCTHHPLEAFTSLLEKAKSLVPIGCALEAIEIRTQAAYIISIYTENLKIVVAQVETVWQDGCVPPVHTVLVNATPIITKHHGRN